MARRLFGDHYATPEPDFYGSSGHEQVTPDGAPQQHSSLTGGRVDLYVTRTPPRSAAPHTLPAKTRVA